jgi:hypothetical protein
MASGRGLGGGGDEEVLEGKIVLGRGKFDERGRLF